MMKLFDLSISQTEGSLMDVWRYDAAASDPLLFGTTSLVCREAQINSYAKSENLTSRVSVFSLIFTSQFAA